MNLRFYFVVYLKIWGHLWKDPQWTLFIFVPMFVGYQMSGQPPGYMTWLAVLFAAVGMGMGLHDHRRKRKHDEVHQREGGSSVLP